MTNLVFRDDLVTRIFYADGEPGTFQEEVNNLSFLDNEVGFWAFDTVNNRAYVCTYHSGTELGWTEVVPFSGNLNTARAYTQRSTPAFNTAYTPNANNDTFVSAIVSQSNTLTQTTSISFQVDFGSGYVTLATFASNGIVIGVAAARTDTFGVIVPKNCPYKLVASGAGTNTLVSIQELSL